MRPWAAEPKVRTEKGADMTDKQLRDSAIILPGMGDVWIDSREDEPTRNSLRVARGFAKAWLAERDVGSPELAGGTE